MWYPMKIEDIPKELHSFITKKDIESCKKSYRKHCDKQKSKGIVPKEKEKFFYDYIMLRAGQKYQHHLRELETQKIESKWKGVSSPPTLYDKLKKDVIYNSLAKQRYETDDSPSWFHNRIKVKNAGDWKKPKHGAVEIITDNSIINSHITNCNPRKKFESK